MFLRVPKEVVKLAQLFKQNGEKLYLVGGFIRNQLLGIDDSENLDIDVCSSCLPEKVIKIVNGSNFKANYLNEEMGVVEIIGKIRVEHATFRREKYAFSGVHLPENVEFITSLSEDAERRDFRCNAVYYDILEEEIVDPLGGEDDIKNRVIQTTRRPEEVFRDDGERIIRMVRLACTLGFDIESKTYAAAKQNIRKLSSISRSRLREEFSQIVLADTEYKFLPGKKYAHARGIQMLADLDGLKPILPALDAILKSGLIDDRNKPLFDHVLNVFAFSKPEVRLSALLHDVGKARAKLEYGNFSGEEEYAQIIIEKNLGIDGLGYSKKIVERVKKVVLGVNFNKSGLEIAKNVKHFIADNYDEINLIIDLKDAIALDKSNRRHGSYSANVLRKTLKKMQKNETPFTLSELKLKGDVLLKNIPNLKVSRTGEVLNNLLYKCIDRPYINIESNLLEMAKKMVARRKKYYLE